MVRKSRDGRLQAVAQLLVGLCPKAQCPHEKEEKYVSTHLSNSLSSAKINKKEQNEPQPPLPLPFILECFTILRLCLLTFFVHAHFLDDIEHLERCLDSCQRLVGIETTRAQQPIAIMPRDYRLHQGIGSAARRDANSIVCQQWKGAPQPLAVNLSQCFHKRIVLRSEEHT